MCYTIPTKVILTNVLANTTEPVGPYELKQAQKKLYRELKNEMFYADVSRDSVCMEVEANPWMFKWNGEKIERAQDSSKYFEPSYIREKVNFNLPENYKDTFLKIFFHNEL